MPAKRKKQIVKKQIVRKTSKKTPTYTTNGPTYDTQMIITIMLLLFVYPLGLIFMWAWMHQWPMWLKSIITLPFLVGIFIMITIFGFVGGAIRNARSERMLYQYQYQTQHSMMRISPPPTNSGY